MRSKELSILRDLDTKLAIVGIVFSLLLIIFLVREFGRFIYVLTGVLALISCILWLLIRKSHTFKFQMTESRTQTLICSIFFFALFTLSIFSVYFRPDIYERPLSYFALTTLMAGVIAWEILVSGRRHIGLILIQILLLGTSIAWSQLLIFPSLVGADPWYHSAVTNRIIEDGFISGGAYSKLPLFHLMIASTSLLIDLPYKLATMLSVSIGQIVCNAMFVFLIANILFKNHRVGLLASLFVIIANNHIYMSYWSIPNGFGVVFIPIVLYLILSRMSTDNEGNEKVFGTIIILLFMVTIVLTHTVAAMGMAVILIVAWIASKFYEGPRIRAGNHVAFSIPLGFTVMMFTWWTYASGHIQTLGSLVEWGFSADFFSSSPAEVISYGISIPLSEQLFNFLGMFLFFALSFIGIFYMISRRGNFSTFTISWAMIAPLTISFFSLITGHSVIEHRWWYLGQILLSVPLAFSIYLLATWKPRHPVRAHAFITCFVIVFSFLLIMSPIANVDNHTFSPNSAVTPSLTGSEMQSINAIAALYSGQIGTERYVTNIISISPINIKLTMIDDRIYSGNFTELQMQNLLVREEIKENTFKLYQGPYRLDYDLEQKLYEQDFTRTYKSNSVNIYTKA
jgi:hypothetical protein